MLAFTIDKIATPMGDMLIVTDADGALRALEWTDLEERMARLLQRQYKNDPPKLTHGPAPIGIKENLRSFFDGQLNALEGLPVGMGGTAFQRSVWSALRAIPVGDTCSYQDIANAIGNPKAVRAVGLANGANPIGIVVPCHRVIGANGTMTGYGGGIARKEWLLRHEGALASVLV